VPHPADPINTLQEDDYLFEITMHVAVRKQDAALVRSLGTSPCEEDETDDDRVLSAVMDIAGTGLVECEVLIAYDSKRGRRVSLEEFRKLEGWM
jgi:hypothetical protein